MHNCLRVQDNILFWSKYLTKIFFLNIFNLFFTPEVKLRTNYGMASVRPSVCLSVCPGIPMGTCWVPKYLTNVHL